LTSDKTTKRLRRIMIAVLLFSAILTLSGQPESYWHHPQTAIRGDGLSIGNATNHGFEFFLGRGWQAFIMTSMLYLAGAFLLVSLLPRKAALIAIFSFIFGHYFGETNWLVVRWHLGIGGASIYALVLALMLVLSAFPKPGPNTNRVIRALRWVMVGAMSLDMINTLLGQPPGYWHHPETVHEANNFSRFLLSRGWYAYLFHRPGLFLRNVLARIDTSRDMGLNLYLLLYLSELYRGVQLVFFRMENGNGNPRYLWRITKRTHSFAGISCDI
jgi:hypothetical protein